MPRDASETKSRLLEAGERLFADEGIDAVALSRIVEAAGQRNVSALHYHFGSRLGLVFAIINRHNVTIEEARAGMLSGHPADLDGVPLRPLVESFVIPFAAKLADDSGQRFLCIVSQLVDRFAQWDVENAESPRESQRVLRAIDRRLALAPLSLPAELRHDRVTRFVESVSEALGTRARATLRGRSAVLSPERFVANLVDMSIGALSATASTIAYGTSRR